MVLEDRIFFIKIILVIKKIILLITEFIFCSFLYVKDIVLVILV